MTPPRDFAVRLPGVTRCDPSSAYPCNQTSELTSQHSHQSCTAVDLWPRSAPTDLSSVVYHALARLRTSVVYRPAPSMVYGLTMLPQPLCACLLRRPCAVCRPVPLTTLPHCHNIPCPLFTLLASSLSAAPAQASPLQRTDCSLLGLPERQGCRWTVATNIGLLCRRRAAPPAQPLSRKVALSSARATQRYTGPHLCPLCPVCARCARCDRHRMAVVCAPVVE